MGNKTVGLIGAGVVGKATRLLLEQAGLDVLAYDAAYDAGSTIAEINQKADIVFLCVPTPMKKTGQIDLSILRSVIEELDGGQILVIRSTVVPGTCEKLQDENSEFVFCFVPEFLTEANPYEDSKNATRLVVGYDNDLAGITIAMIFIWLVIMIRA